MSRRILIIDDEENIRRVTRLTLQAAGYEVGEAGDGERGLEAFKDGSGWDAVLLDQRMPGMDGLETLRQIKERQPNACVIMSTAYASIGHQRPLPPQTLRRCSSNAGNQSGNRLDDLPSWGLSITSRAKIAMLHSGENGRPMNVEAGLPTKTQPHLPTLRDTRAGNENGRHRSPAGCRE